MITFYNTHLFTVTPWIKVYFEKLTAVYTVKKIPYHSRNPKVYYNVYNNPSLVPLLSQINPVAILLTCFRSTGKINYWSHHVCPFVWFKWNSTTSNRQLSATFYVWSFHRNWSTHSNFGQNWKRKNIAWKPMCM